MRTESRKYLSGTVREPFKVVGWLLHFGGDFDLRHATPTPNSCGNRGMDTDIGTELFSGYENDFNLIVADISSKLQGIQDQDGEPRKSGIRAAERAVEEAEEIVPTSAISLTVA
jgi:hypothetical protein